MPYIFNWHDPEHTIIRVEMVGLVSWEAFSIVTDRVVDELAKTSHRIDLIYDDKVGMPKGNPMPPYQSDQCAYGSIRKLWTDCYSEFTEHIQFYQDHDRHHVAGLPD